MTAFHPIATIPDAMKDGREVTIRHGEKPWIRRARWSPDRWDVGRGAWICAETGGTLLGVESWAG